MKDIWTLIPQIYTEFRSKSADHSGSVSGAILSKFEKVPVFEGIDLFKEQGSQNIAGITKNVGDCIVQLGELPKANDPKLKLNFSHTVELASAQN